MRPYNFPLYFLAQPHRGDAWWNVFPTDADFEEAAARAASDNSPGDDPVYDLTHDLSDWVLTDDIEVIRDVAESEAHPLRYKAAAMLRYEGVTND